MKKFHFFASYETADEVKPLVYEIVSKVARVSGISIIRSPFAYSIMVNLTGGPVGGLPKRARGVRIVYRYFARPQIRALSQ